MSKNPNSGQAKSRVQQLVAPLLMTIIFLAAPLQASDYEQNPTFKASEIPSPKLLSSDVHQVADEVTNDGYMNTYLVQSEYGDFPAYGGTLLQIRVQEVKALDELSRVEKSDQYMEVAANVVIVPLKAVGQIAANPVDTVKGIPDGLGRMFRGFGRTAKSVTAAVTKDDEKEGAETEGTDAEGTDTEGSKDENKAEEYALMFMGINSAQRKWAKKLGVDPYSSNSVLQEEIAKVASVDTYANFGTKLIPGMGVLNLVVTTTNMVWEIDPAELREQNLKRLLAQGATQEQVDGFLNNTFYSPTLQTIIVVSLLEMEGVENRGVVLENALRAQTMEQAVFFADTIRMLAGFHIKVNPLVSLNGAGATIGGLSTDKRLVYAIPLDHLVWTESMARVVNDRLQPTADSIGKPTRELWLRGSATPRAVEELAQRGWVVQQNIEAKVRRDEMPE